MSATDNGGHAFPTSPGDPNTSASSYSSVYGGMSLRDWLAGQALAGAMSGATNLGELPHPDRVRLLRGIASILYEVADAMLAERSKP